MNLTLPPVIIQTKKDNGLKQKETSQQNHLQTLLDGFVDLSEVKKYKPAFKGLSDNSNKVHEDFLFLASAGRCIVTDKQTKKWPQHGIAYAGDAINRGASLILWEPTEELNEMPSSCVVKGRAEVPLIRINLLHEKIGEIASRFYQHPSHAMGVIGITGTNGKTSISHFIAQTISVMEQIDSSSEAKKCAVVGTLGNGIYGELEESTHTTPDAVTLQALMAEFKEQGVNTVVMEVSSHALAQGRVNGVEFNTAVFSNLSRDHLDYHGDMNSYADEKLKLFQFSSIQHIVLNLDDAFSEKIIADVNQAQNSVSIVTYSKENKKADYFADNIVMSNEGISFELVQQSKTAVSYSIKTRLLGDFNIDNLLASIAVLHQQGYALDQIAAQLAKVSTVPGRMEKIGIDKEQALMVIDYAHTPDALEKSLMALKAHTQGQLICVFGCGGDRDKGKRRLMAQIAEVQADKVIVTSDNPRTESAEQIIDEVMQGFNDTKPIIVEIDREQAIKKAIQYATVDDVILVAGKGHEDYQDIQGVKRPFSDKACILAAIEQGIGQSNECLH